MLRKMAVDGGDRAVLPLPLFAYDPTNIKNTPANLS
jgi:hypothetical protein